MTEMVERVARAMWEWQRSNCFIAGTIPVADLWPAWESAKEDSRESELGRARAAIEAMRAPTEAMGEAGDGVPSGPGFCDEPGDPPSVYGIWQAMIDEALK